MKTWQIVAIVGSCVLAMLAVIAITLLMIDRSKTGPTKEEMLIVEVHGQYPDSTTWPDQTIVSIAKDTCASLDRGDSMSATINLIAAKYPVGAEADYDLLAFTMVTGIKELCPQHIDEARRFSRGG